MSKANEWERTKPDLFDGLTDYINHLEKLDDQAVIESRDGDVLINFPDGSVYRMKRSR